MSEEIPTPAEVVDLITRTGITGEVMQVRCKVLDGKDKNRIITRNTRGPIKKGDIIMLKETEREAKRISIT